MLIGELDERLKFLELKIIDLESYIENNDLENYNDVLNELFNLYDTRRSYNILLRRSAENTTIRVGKTDVTVADAKDLLSTVGAKINAISKLISDIPPNLSMLQLMEQRDKLIDERIMLDASIKISSWSTKVD